MNELLLEHLFESERALRHIIMDEKIQREILIAADYMASALKGGRKLIAIGNGGSMCDAIHFCSELTGKYKDNRDPLAAIALSDPGALSCIGNDYGYHNVFGRQVQALLNQGDLLLAISTSGASENVLRAMATAASKDCYTIGLTSDKCGSAFSDQCEVCIEVPSKNTGIIQQCHTTIIHCLVDLIEHKLKL